MEAVRTSEGLRLEGFGEMAAEMLARIPTTAAPIEDESAKERMFPFPGSDAKTNRDWEELVHPELRHLFQTAMETVSNDLRNLEENAETGSWSLFIPATHFEAWLNALNQVRLGLAAQYGFDQQAIDREIPYLLETRADFALIQIDFYGSMQAVILHGLA